MNILVKDIELFQNVEPEAAFASYLESRGLQGQRQIDNQRKFGKRMGINPLIIWFYR